MARVKRAVHSKKHRRAVLEEAQGYYGNKSRSYRAAHEQIMHSGLYVFRDRGAQRRVSSALGAAGQRGQPGEWTELQPLYRWLESGGRSPRPQGAG